MAYVVNINGVSYTLPSHGDTTSWDNGAAGLNAFFSALGTALPGNAVAVYKTATSYSFATGVTAQMNYDTSEIDTDSAVTVGASWKFTCPTTKAGNYLVSAAISLTGAVGTSVQFQLFKNGSAVRTLLKSTGTVPAGQSIAGNTIIALAAGDYIDIRLTQSSGGTVTTTTSALENYISLTRLTK
ncbi:MAG: hypothetical protein NVS3B25_09930 [Hymenobacter sp.]